MEEGPKATDLLGIKPYGEALKIAVEKGFEGASALLSRVCLPGAEELGLWYRDKVRYWRLKNVIAILKTAEGKILFDGKELQLHPRVMHEILEEGSWCDDSQLQDMWAGLLASSCSSDVPSDKNLLFINKLKQLTSTQAKLIDYICNNCKAGLTQNSLIVGVKLVVSGNALIEITGVTDIEQLDAELDSMRSLELIGYGIGGGGFNASASALQADITPSAFLLNLYGKTRGFNGSVADFYKNQVIPIDNYGDPFPPNEIGGVL